MQCVISRIDSERICHGKIKIQKEEKENKTIEEEGRWYKIRYNRFFVFSFRYIFSLSLLVLSSAKFFCPNRQTDNKSHAVNPFQASNTRTYVPLHT